MRDDQLRYYAFVTSRGVYVAALPDVVNEYDEALHGLRVNLLDAVERSGGLLHSVRVDIRPDLVDLTIRVVAFISTGEGLHEKLTRWQDERPAARAARRPVQAPFQFARNQEIRKLYDDPRPSVERLRVRPEPVPPVEEYSETERRFMCDVVLPAVHAAGVEIDTTTPEFRALVREIHERAVVALVPKLFPLTTSHEELDRYAAVAAPSGHGAVSLSHHEEAALAAFGAPQERRDAGQVGLTR